MPNVGKWAIGDGLRIVYIVQIVEDVEIVVLWKSAIRNREPA
jgi:hypothetical protein